MLVLDRDAQANGASIRNFGFVLVTGQTPGEDHARARRGRDAWLELVSAAGIAVEHRGALLAVRRAEAMALLEAFMQDGRGEGCRLLSRRALLALQPELDGAEMAGGLYSPHELRVESRDAIPRLTDYLARSCGVAFRFGAAVTAIAPPEVGTSFGPVHASKVVVCPGDDLTSLYADRIAAHGVTRCRLQMLRIVDPGFRLSAGVMSDLSLLRYGGFAHLPEADALRNRVLAEQPEMLANGVHMIAVQSADGSMVLGDSHHYGPTPDPFGSDAIDRMILSEYAAVFGSRPISVTARWTGSYASADVSVLRDAPHPDVRLIIVTSGTGASAGFAIGEETMAEMYA